MALPLCTQWQIRCSFDGEFPLSLIEQDLELGLSDYYSHTILPSIFAVNIVALTYQLPYLVVHVSCCGNQSGQRKGA
jgi:hypothetical protein